MQSTKPAFQKLNAPETYQIVFALCDRMKGGESNDVVFRPEMLEENFGAAFKVLIRVLGLCTSCTRISVRQ